MGKKTQKWIDRTSYLVVGAVLTMLFLKWFGFIDISYLVVFSPVFVVIASLVGLIIVSVVIGSIAMAYRKWKAKK